MQHICILSNYNIENAKDIHHKGYQPCIHKSRHFHFSSCEITQTLCQTPNQIAAEVTCRTKVFQEQASFH